MRLCRIVLVGFGVLYALAMVLFLIGTFGLFGQEEDALSAVFLVLLGQPWIRAADTLPETLRPLAVALAPAITLAILWLACRFLMRGRA